MIAGFVKTFGVTFDYALYNISYTNLIMYSATIPSYDSGERKKQDIVKADDPKNKDKVHSIIEGFD